MDLPDEWVEAAARALWAHDWPETPDWPSEHGLRTEYLKAARAALAAVAPLIAAQALRDAVSDFESSVAAEVWEFQGPYMYWLLNRADRIERSES